MNIVLVNKNLLVVSKKMLKVVEKADKPELFTEAKKAIAAAEKVSVSEELTNQVLGSVKDVANTQAIQDLKGTASEKIRAFLLNAIDKVLSGKK